MQRSCRYVASFCCPAVATSDVAEEGKRTHTEPFALARIHPTFPWDGGRHAADRPRVVGDRPRDGARLGLPPCVRRGLAGLYSLRPGLLTEQGIVERSRRLKIGTWTMAIVAWLTVFTGSYVVYPWYRDPALDSPKSVLLANPNTADWHEFAMEWKEHIAWIAPILATAVAFAVTYYGTSLIKHQGVRRWLMVFFSAAFVIAAIAGLFGALITKAAPVH